MAEPKYPLERRTATGGVFMKACHQDGGVVIHIPVSTPNGQMRLLELQVSMDWLDQLVADFEIMKSDYHPPRRNEHG